MIIEVATPQLYLPLLARQIGGNWFHAYLKGQYPFSARSGFSLLVILLGWERTEECKPGPVDTLSPRLDTRPHTFPIGENGELGNFESGNGDFWAAWPAVCWHMMWPRSPVTRMWPRDVIIIDRTQDWHLTPTRGKLCECNSALRNTNSQSILQICSDKCMYVCTMSMS